MPEINVKQIVKEWKKELKNRINGKIQGDANSSVYNIARLNYTPVPGGVGLLTRMQLIENIVKAYIEI